MSFASCAAGVACVSAKSTHALRVSTEREVWREAQGREPILFVILDMHAINSRIYMRVRGWKIHIDRFAWH